MSWSPPAPDYTEKENDAGEKGRLYSIRNCLKGEVGWVIVIAKEIGPASAK